MLLKKKLFNPEGNDTPFARQIIGGNTTNLFQLNSVRYNWALSLYQRMLANFWIPEKTDLTQDINDYKLITPEEKKAFNGILSFLVFLDSLQTVNVPHISDWITAPEINLALAVHSFQEAIHSSSYQYIIESIIPKEDRDSIYEYWREDQVLLERNKYIAELFQEFLDNPNEDTFFNVLIANYLLEGLYFYNGFTFFYALAIRHLLGGTADIIRLIQRDEETHLILFQNIITEYVKQNNITNYQSVILDLTAIAVEQEIKWSNHIIGNNILGMNEESTDNHTKYLANLRLKRLNLDLPTLYTESKYQINPYKHLDKLSDSKGNGEVKANFFEQTVTSYNMSTAVKNWDF